MTPKPVEWAKVVVQDESEWGTQFTVEFRGIEVSMHEDSGREEADAFCAEVNTALSPLLARAALLDRAVEIMKHFREADCDGAHEIPRNTDVHGFQMAHDFLTAYASLPKMGEKKGESNGVQ